MWFRYLQPFGVSILIPGLNHIIGFGHTEALSYTTQKLSIGFDQPDVMVYKSQPGGSVTLYHPLCHASRDSKMGGFAHP